MNLRSFFFYHLHLNRLFSTDLHLFEVSVWIQAFAQSLISVFIPIILWRVGLSIKEIIIFYIIFNAFDVPLNLLARHLIVKYGARVVIIMSIFADLIYLITLYSLHNNWPSIVLLALAAAIFDTFYWIGHIYIFVQSAHGTEKMRTDVSALNIVRTIGGLLAPAIGALILVSADYKTLVFLSTMLMFLSLIPLFRMRHLVFKPQEVLPIKNFFKEPIEKINYLFQALSAVEAEVEDVIWPFFVFFIFSSIKQAASIPVIISLAGLIITYITGRYSLKRNIYQLISFGALILGLLWTIRVFDLSSIGLLYITVFFIGLTRILVDLPIDVAIFERGKKTDVLNASTFRNLVHMGARLLLYLLLFFVGNYFINSAYIVIIMMFFLFASSMLVSLSRNKLLQMQTEPVEVEIEDKE